MKQIGKVGKSNIKANKKIEQIAQDKGIYYCEVCPVLYSLGMLDRPCLQSHSNAHRHERVDYRHNPDKLWDFKQWVYACIPSHQLMDSNKELRERIFIILRGEDNISN